MRGVGVHPWHLCLRPSLTNLGAYFFSYLQSLLFPLGSSNFRCSLISASSRSLVHKNPVTYQNIWFYLMVVQVIRMTKYDYRLSNKLDTDLQKLRCRVNYHALRFTDPIQELGERLIQRMRKKSRYFVALHLRYSSFCNINEPVISLHFLFCSKFAVSTHSVAIIWILSLLWTSDLKMMSAAYGPLQET